jgi:DNA repair protein RecO (recombination protein O)
MDVAAVRGRPRSQRRSPVFPAITTTPMAIHAKVRARTPPSYDAAMPSVRTPALILRKFEFGESSQVLHLLTRDRGRVHVLAKGSLKPKSSFLGPLDVLELGEARLYPKRDALSILGGFERGTAFPGIRRSLPRLEAAFGILEVLSEASSEEHADPGLFDLAEESLRGLETTPGERAPLALLRFDLRALAALGLGPVLAACVVCGRGLEKERNPVLSPARGGALCGDCRGQDVLALHATRGVLAALARLGGGDGSAAARLALGPRDLRLARRLVDALLGHAVEKEIRGARR